MDAIGKRTVHFKWYHGRSVRRFALNFNAGADNYSTLKNKINEYFHQNGDTIEDALYWIDPDGDHVILDSNESLDEALYYYQKERLTLITQRAVTEKDKSEHGHRRKRGRHLRSRSHDRHPRRRHAKSRSHSRGRRSSSSSSSSSTTSSSSSSLCGSVYASRCKRAKKEKKFAKKMKKLHKKCPWMFADDHGFVHVGSDAHSDSQQGENQKERTTEYAEGTENAEKGYGHAKSQFSYTFGPFGCHGFMPPPPPPPPPHGSWGHFWSHFPSPPHHHGHHHRSQHERSPEPEHTGNKVHKLEKKLDKMTVNVDEQ